MSIWFKPSALSELIIQTCEARPGTEWHELDRHPLAGETVQFLDGRAVIVTPPVAEEQAPVDFRRAALITALPDILLAVAEGKDLRDEVRKVIDSVEVQGE